MRWKRVKKTQPSAAGKPRPQRGVAHATFFEFPTIPAIPPRAVAIFPNIRRFRRAYPPNPVARPCGRPAHGAAEISSYAASLRKSSAIRKNCHRAGRDSRNRRKFEKTGRDSGQNRLSAHRGMGFWWVRFVLSNSSLQTRNCFAIICRLFSRPHSLEVRTRPFQG